MNTPTPWTDANEEDGWNPCGWAVDSNLVRELERELTAAREELKETKKHLKDANRGAEINAHALRINADKLTTVTEQRDRLLEEREQWRLSSVCRELTAQLNEAREKLKVVTEQRDKLAELGGFGEFDKPIFP